MSRASHEVCRSKCLHEIRINVSDLIERAWGIAASSALVAEGPIEESPVPAPDRDVGAAAYAPPPPPPATPAETRRDRLELLIPALLAAIGLAAALIAWRTS